MLIVLESKQLSVVTEAELIKLQLIGNYGSVIPNVHVVILYPPLTRHVVAHMRIGNFTIELTYAHTVRHTAIKFLHGGQTRRWENFYREDHAPSHPGFFSTRISYFRALSQRNYAFLWPTMRNSTQFYPRSMRSVAH